MLVVEPNYILDLYVGMHIPLLLGGWPSNEGGLGGPTPLAGGAWGSMSP
jgi:hypothetical protein